MDIEVRTYFEDDAKEYAFCDMLELLIKRLKKNTGINLRKLDEEEANRILRDLVKDFAAFVLDDAEDDATGNSWLSMALSEME